MKTYLHASLFLFMAVVMVPDSSASEGEVTLRFPEIKPEIARIQITENYTVPATQAKTQAKPNILVLMIDDCGAFGNLGTFEEKSSFDRTIKFYWSGHGQNWNIERAVTSPINWQGQPFGFKLDDPPDLYSLAEMARAQGDLEWADLLEELAGSGLELKRRSVDFTVESQEIGVINATLPGEGGTTQVDGIEFRFDGKNGQVRRLRASPKTVREIGVIGLLALGLILTCSVKRLSRAPTASSAITKQDRAEYLEFLQGEEALTADPPKKFLLMKLIEKEKKLRDNVA